MPSIVLLPVIYIICTIEQNRKQQENIFFVVQAEEII